MMSKWNEVPNYQLDNLNINIVNDNYNIIIADASYDSFILQTKFFTACYDKR